MKKIITLFFLCILIIYPKICVTGARNGLILWGFTLVPTLLPFFIITKIILQWKIPGKLLFPYLLFVGFFCGYPTGASVVGQLYDSKIFTKKQAELMICLCDHVSPAFLISFVHYNYFQKQITLPFFLFPIYGSILIAGCIFFFILHDETKTAHMSYYASCPKKTDEIFMESVVTILKIGCYVILFSIFIQIAFSTFASHIRLLGILSCFLEITSGIHHLTTLPISPSVILALTGALCSFGGYCSIAQVGSVIPKELSITPYILFKICTGLTTFIFFILFY